MEIALANEGKVRSLMNHLVKAFEEYFNQDKEADHLDTFMAVHNFHILILLEIEQRKKMNHKEKLLFRKMAIDTFSQSLERRP